MQLRRFGGVLRQQEEIIGQFHNVVETVGHEYKLQEYDRVDLGDLNKYVWEEEGDDRPIMRTTFRKMEKYFEDQDQLMLQDDTQEIVQEDASEIYEKGD